MEGQTNPTLDANRSEVTTPTPTAQVEPKSADIVFSPEDFVDTPDQNDEDDVDDTEDNDDGDEPKQTKQTSGIKVKFNGKEEILPIEKAVEYAQKGMNYDHVAQERDALKNSPELMILKELAEESGLPDAKTFVETLRNNTIQAKKDARTQELMDNGYDRKQAEYVADLEIKAKMAEKGQTPPPAKSNDKTDDFKELLEAYPEARKYPDFDSYPPEVKEAILKGEKPIVAYSKYLAQKAETDAQIARQNELSKASDTGSLGTKETGEKKDDFLSGLFG